MFEQALAIIHELGNQQIEVGILMNLGIISSYLGEIERAIACFEHVLILARSMGNLLAESQALNNLGDAYLACGDIPRAIDVSIASCAIAQALGNQHVEGIALGCVARAQVLNGNLELALATFAQAQVLLRVVGDRMGESSEQWDFGLILAEQGAREQALPLLRAALAYEQDISHAQASAHAEILARLEAGEPLPPRAPRPRP